MGRAAPGLTVGGGPRVVRLSESRVLALAEFGDPDGLALINCHGGLTGRLDIEAADEAAGRAGVRIVSPDRPGIGRSTRQRGRTIIDWADDVRGLADALGLDRFWVLGWSFGGPYAAAVAARLPERVVSATIVAGGVPLSWPSAAGGFASRTDKALFRLARRTPLLAATVMRGVGAMAAAAPRLWMRAAAASMTPRDVEAVERDGVVPFARSVAEGLRRPGGAVDDYVAYGGPWGFDYESVTVPVHLWQGEDDTYVPPEWSREAARRLPRATLVTVPGCGHFVARDHWDSIFGEMVEEAGTRP